MHNEIAQMFWEHVDLLLMKHLGLELNIDPKVTYPTRLPPSGSGVKLGNRLKRVEINEKDRK